MAFGHLKAHQFKKGAPKPKVTFGKGGPIKSDKRAAVIGTKNYQPKQKGIDTSPSMNFRKKVGM